MKALVKEYQKKLQIMGFKLTEKEREYKHIKRQADNPLQISAITEEKKRKILENTGIVINENKQQHREKYFSGLKPIKFFRGLVQEIVNDSSTAIYNHLETQFFNDFIKSVALYSAVIEAQDIPEIYAMKYGQLNDNGKRVFIGSSSCMQGKPKSWFEVYEDTINLRMICLVDKDKNIYARALLWQDVEQDIFYLDRIYTAEVFNSSDSIKAVYQAQVYKHAKRLTGAKQLNCYSLSHFKHELTTEEKGEAITTPPTAMIIQLENCYDNYSYFPYADTFQGIEGNEWQIDGENADVLLNQTSGENGNDIMCTCDNCGARHEEEESYYSEVDDMTLCEECAIYCEDREEYICESEAVYNSHSGHYHHRADLDI